MIRYEEQLYKETVIKTVGIGGGGTNAINYMGMNGLGENVTLIAVNTDAQHLETIRADDKICIGKKITNGKGAGSMPEKGKRAMEESIDEVMERLQGADLIFLIACLGGGTGTGGIPVLAQALKEQNMFTVAIVSKPWSFEGPIKMKRAEKALMELKDKVNTLIVISNDKLIEIAELQKSFNDCLDIANNSLYLGVKGIVDIIQKPGHINVDFADVHTVLSKGGRALMGIGIAKGEKRAIEAVKKAISSPIFEGVDIGRAKGILVNIFGKEVHTDEYKDISSFLYEQINHNGDIDIISGFGIDENLQEELTVTVIAAGIEEERPRKREFAPYIDIEYSKTQEDDLRTPAFVRANNKRGGINLWEEKSPENGNDEEDI